MKPTLDTQTFLASRGLYHCRINKKSAVLLSYQRRQKYDATQGRCFSYEVRCSFLALSAHYFQLYTDEYIVLIIYVEGHFGTVYDCFFKYNRSQ